MQDEYIKALGRRDVLCAALCIVVKQLIKTPDDRNLAVTAKVLSNLLLQQLDELGVEAHHA